jgi:hypothetical protein
MSTLSEIEPVIEAQRAATSYAQLGFSVIPIRPRDKSPAVKWEPYQTRKPTDAELAEWFGDGQAHNIGIVTGAISGVVVLDVDGSEGQATIAGRELPPTPCVRTAKGWHYYYKWPGRTVRNFASRLPGLDLRGDGGYVLAPPSVHPDGPRYEWAVGLDVPLAAPPTWLLDLLDTAGPPPGKSSDWLTRTLRGVAEGQRNDAATRIAGRLRRAGLHSETVLEILRCWNHRNTPPLPDDELCGVARSAAKMDGPACRGVRRTGSELLAMEFAPLRWIVPGLLPEGVLAVIASKSKLGKTWLMLQLATAVAAGGVFLGRRLDPAVVVYYALEDGDRFIQDRLRLQRAPANLERLIFYNAITPLNTPQGMEEFGDVIRNEHPRLAIIDTLAAAKTGKLDENLAGDFADLANPLRDLAHSAGTTILPVHHHGKLTSGDAVMDLRGSTAFGAAVDVILGLYRERGQARAKLGATGRNVLDCELALDFDPVTHSWQLVGRADEVAMGEAESETMDVLGELGEADANTMAGAVGKSRQAVCKTLVRLVAQGKVSERDISTKHGPKKLYRLQQLHVAPVAPATGATCNPSMRQEGCTLIQDEVGEGYPVPLV